MTAYQVTGRPLNPYEVLGAGAENVRAQMQVTPAGGTINVTLTGPEDTKVKGHGCLK